MELTVEEVVAQLSELGKQEWEKAQLRALVQKQTVEINTLNQLIEEKNTTINELSASISPARRGKNI